MFKIASNLFTIGRARSKRRQTRRKRASTSRRGTTSRSLLCIKVGLRRSSHHRGALTTTSRPVQCVAPKMFGNRWCVCFIFVFFSLTYN